MEATLVIRLDEGLKAELETMVAETGAWSHISEVVREAVERFIADHWEGPRLAR